MTYLLETRRFALPTPKKANGMTMATFLLSSEESCEGGHGLCHPPLEKRRYALLSSPRKESIMTLVIFFLSSIESCVGDLGTSSIEKRRYALPTPKKQRSMTMATFYFPQWRVVKKRPWPIPSSSRINKVCPILLLRRREG